MVIDVGAAARAATWRGAHHSAHIVTTGRYPGAVTSRFLVIIGGCLMLGACASTGAVPRPFPVPGGSPAPSTVVPETGNTKPPPRDDVVASPAASADGYSISSTALSLRGAPYRNGGSDPAGFDCSGFVLYVFEQHGLAMPREVRKQFERGKNVNARSLEPGDLVFFTTNAPGVSHVGIAIGGDQFVHAPSTNGVVRVEHLSAAYWSNRFVGAKRVN